jgi:hypothetical protein
MHNKTPTRGKRRASIFRLENNFIKECLGIRKKPAGDHGAARRERWERA